jgi:hypothetical protein
MLTRLRHLVRTLRRTFTLATHPEWPHACRASARCGVHRPIGARHIEPCIHCYTPHYPVMSGRLEDA